MIFQFIFSVLMLLGTFFSVSTSTATTTSSGHVVLTGAVRDIYSKEIFFQAQPRLRFTQFAKIRRDFQATKGKSIIFTKYNNLTGGGAISEDAAIDKDNLTTSTVQISVTEHAKAIQVTEALLQLSFQDVMGDASKVLANHLAVSIDTLLRDAALTSTNIFFGDGTLADAAAFNAASAAAKSFNTATVKTAIEYLSSNNAPRFDGEYYVCFATPKQLRQLKDDSNWVEANKYMGRRQLYVGEVGMYEGCIFIETTQMPVYPLAANAVAAGWASVTLTNTHEAVFFGENAYAWGIALDPELRDDGVQDFGRKHALAWYGIWGAGLLEEDNIFKVLTQ